MDRKFNLDIYRYYTFLSNKVVLIKLLLNFPGKLMFFIETFRFILMELIQLMFFYILQKTKNIGYKEILKISLVS